MSKCALRLTAGDLLMEASLPPTDKAYNNGMLFEGQR